LTRGERRTTIDDVRRRGAIWGTTAAAAALALIAPGTAFGADILVNREGDGTPTDPNCRTTSTCTLRDAVALATSSDVVRVPAGTYVLTQGEISLVNTTIVGAGALSTTIDGNNQSRVLRGQRGTNSITGVTITRGNGLGLQDSGGGAIRVDLGSFTLTDSAVVGNRSPGLAGGIATATNNASLVLLRSTVSGNVAAAAAAPSQGGGIYVVAGSTAMITNSTVSGNDAGTGGNILNAGTLTLNFATVAADARGGGLNQAPAPSGGASSTTLSNSIIAGGAGPACAGTVAQINPSSGSHNVVDDSSCALGGTGDRENVDPMLGSLTNNGGPTNTHALLGGSPAIDAGDGCAATDQRGAARSGACDIGAFEYIPPLPLQPGPPPPPPDDELPPPVAGESVNAVPRRGRVRVRLPGTARFVRLEEAEQLPVGTTFDTRDGRVTLFAAGDQSATFYAGIFRLTQNRAAKPRTTLTLTERLACGRAGGARIAARGKKKRRLWGDGSGKFRTKGKHSAATVVGTKWLVQDRCTSTMTRVVRGRVSVRDFAKKKTVIVRAGKKYTARPG
jgi:hypothetical protein